MRKLLVIASALAATQFAPASAADQTANGVIERAEKAFASQLALTRAPDNGGSVQATWIAKDAIYQYALRDIGVSLRVEGRAAVSAHLRALADAAPGAGVENIRFFPTMEPDVVFVQYDVVPADGGERSSPLAIIQMQGEQIVKFTQLNRTPESLQALKATTEPIN
jgi:hypothetical protein